MQTDDPYGEFAAPDPASLLAVRNIGPTTYATVTTTSIASVETPVIGEAIHGLLESAPSGLRHLVIDLEQVTLLNSMALSMLLTAYSTALNQDVRMILSGVSDSLLDLLTTTKLTTILPVCRTPAELEAALR